MWLIIWGLGAVPGEPLRAVSPGSVCPKWFPASLARKTLSLVHKLALSHPRLGGGGSGGGVDRNP